MINCETKDINWMNSKVHLILNSTVLFLILSPLIPMSFTNGRVRKSLKDEALKIKYASHSNDVFNGRKVSVMIAFQL